MNGDCVEKVSDFRLLDTHISEDLPWTTNNTVVKKSQQRLYFLRILRKNNPEEKLLVSFYCCSIESVLAYCVTTWYALQRKAKPFRGSSTLPRKSLVAHCPP